MLTVTAKNQVTLPVGMLSQLGAGRGDKLLFRMKGRVLEVEKMRVRLEDVQGVLSLTPAGKKLSLEEAIKRAEKKEAGRIINEG